MAYHRKDSGMEIKVLDEGKPYVIALQGRLDTNTSPRLEEFANGLFGKGVFDLVIDMSACDFVSSAGLRVIVAMQKRVVNTGSLVFRGVTSDVMDVFNMTGFSKILTFA